MATVDNLEIHITADAEAAIQALDRLASSAGRLRGSAKGAGDGLKDTADGAKDAATETQKVQTQTEKTRISLHGFWNALKQSGSYLGGSFLGGLKGIVGVLGSMASGLLRIAKFRIYRTIVKDLGQSFKDLYGWSKMFGSEYANSMDRINSSFVYLRNSIASAAAPLFNALAPVLDAIIDKIVTLLNWLNQLFSALSGASTYTVARKVEQAWVEASSNAASNAKKASDEIKRTILGFDEINKLSKESSDSSSGGGGSSPYTSGYQYMFEEKELAGGWKDFATAIENAMSDAFSRITMIVGGAELALGAILALSGANVPLGLGLMATGAVTLGSAIFANWEGISKEVKLAVAGVEAAVAGGLAVGAVLAFSGGHVGLGIGLMIAALSTGMGAATIAWNTIGDKMSEKVQAIATLVGGASFGIGAVLAFSGHPGIGIAMMIAGASVTAVSINWNYLKEKLEGPIGTVTALISGASLVLGILALLGGNIPIGLGLILAGTAGLATTVAANWDNLVSIGKTAIEKVKEGWETVKELVVNAVVSLVKKVGAWAEDAWEAVKSGTETIVKTVQAIFTEVGTWAGNVWNAVKAGAETIIKEVKAIFTEVGEWAGNVWTAIKNGAETIVKEVKAIFTEVGTWAGNVWDAVKAGAETIVKTVNAIFSEVGTWAGNVWDTVKAGAETIVKEVKAIFTEVGTWAGNVWNTVKAGAETIVKTVEAGMKKLDTWVDSIVDFIRGPESTDKKANIAMAIENTALAIVNFLRDPAEAIKNVMLELGVKFAQGVEKFWNWITGQDGQSEVTVDAYGNFMIVPKAGEGLTDKGNGQFALTNDVAGTTVLTPEKSDNWEEEWDKLVGDEIDVKVKLNAVKGKVEDSIKTWFDNAGGTITTTISTLLTKGGTWINEAWTALTTKDHNTTTSQLLQKGATWVAEAWTALTTGDTVKSRTQQLLKSSNNWNDDANKALMTGDTVKARTQQLLKSSKNWNDDANKALMTGDTVKARTQQLLKSSNNWNDDANKALMTGDTVKSRTQQLLKSSNNWNKKAWTALTKKENKPTTTVSLVRNLISWMDDAWTALTKGSSNPAVKVGLYKQDGAWNNEAWTSISIGDIINKTVQITLKLASGVLEGLKKLLGLVATGGVITNGRLTRFESGGIINNGFVRKLPHYAGGSTDAHGTLFVAGEAGPEILGHIGGRTEILNQSQLAATMFAAVRSAMGGVKIAATFYNGDASESSEADYEMMYRAMYDAFTDAMAPNAERDREKVALMRQIAAKEFTAEVTAASMARANTRMNRRAGTTIMPVGT